MTGKRTESRRHAGARCAGASHVGIIYFVRGKLWTDATPFARACNLGASHSTS